MREAWDAWRAAHANHAPATIVRSRALLLSAIRCGCGEKGLQAPSLPAVGAEKDMRVAMLTTSEGRRLLACYSSHAACPALALADQGMRGPRRCYGWTWTSGPRQFRAGVRAGASQTRLGEATRCP
jgi:hypothetical protein